MNFMILWLATIILSYGLDKLCEMLCMSKMFKDTINAGYKFNFEQYKESKVQTDSDMMNFFLFARLLPFLNLALPFKTMIDYFNVEPNILDYLDALGVLEEMNEYEKKEYQKNPTLFQAIRLLSKSEKAIQNAESISVNIANQTGWIYFYMGDTLNDITILKTTGVASRLSLQDQKNKIIEVYNPFFAHVNNIKSKSFERQQRIEEITKQLRMLKHMKESLYQKDKIETPKEKKIKSGTNREM